ncbi:MAG: aldo/keto reductase family protein [Ignavibacteria bacterium]
MKYRRLGNCGAKVSIIGLGSWLTLGGAVDEKTGKKLIRIALDSGINFFDSADVYALGKAEQFYGKVLSGIKRQDLFLASKCFWPMSENPNDKGLSRKHVYESVHNSLKYLKTDYIDLYQCHRFDTETPVEETCRAFNTLIEQGKILYWGTSEWTKEQLQSAIELCEKYNLHKPVSNQPQYSLLARQIETNGVMNYCKKNGIGLVVWSPLAQGVLTGKYNSGKISEDTRLGNKRYSKFVESYMTKQNVSRVGKLVDTAKRLGTTPSNLALLWCLRNNIVASTITSATKEAQLIENIKAAELEISESEISGIDKIFKSSK